MAAAKPADIQAAAVVLADIPCTTFSCFFIDFSAFSIFTSMSFDFRDASMNSFFVFAFSTALFRLLCICSNSSFCVFRPSSFSLAAMALEKVGDVSPKTKGASYGYYIIKYVGDAAEGPIPLDEVKESLSESLLTTKQNETYDSTLAKWVEEADFKVNTGVLDN